MLITQSSWLLTLSPNCQITIPKSFQTHTFAFRRGNLHSYLLSPLEGAQRYEVFRFVKPPLYSPPHIIGREGKGTKFLTFTSTTLPRHRLAISQRSCQISQPALPHYHPLHPLPLPFSGSAKVRSFSLCQVLSPRTPSLLPSLRGATKLRTFWHLQASLLSKTYSPLKGSAKVRSFSLCQAPLLFRLAFS